MRFTIAIEEIVVGEFEVEANDAEEAMEFAENKYRNGKFLLIPGEVQFKQMAIIQPTKEATEWCEF